MISSGRESMYEVTNTPSIPLQRNGREQMRRTLRWGDVQVTPMLLPQRIDCLRSRPFLKGTTHHFGDGQLPGYTIMLSELIVVKDIVQVRA